MHPECVKGFSTLLVAIVHGDARFGKAIAGAILAEQSVVALPIEEEISRRKPQRALSREPVARRL